MALSTLTEFSPAGTYLFRIVRICANLKFGPSQRSRAAAGTERGCLPGSAAQKAWK